MLYSLAICIGCKVETVTGECLKVCLRRSQPKVRDLALNNSGGFQLPSLFRSLSVDRQ
jgi:hypothetical protein